MCGPTRLPNDYSEIARFAKRTRKVSIDSRNKPRGLPSIGFIGFTELAC
jgi:hypothetical protein